MGSVHIDTTQPGMGALRARSAREWCRCARWAVLVTALMAGLLGMHVLGGHALHSMVGSPAQMASQAHAQMVQPHAAGASDAAECVPAQPAVPADATAHCIPAPGSVPPAPPAAVDLARSDALPRPPALAVPGPVRARAPSPDLSQLSISRT